MTNIIAYVFPACCEVLKTPLQEIVTDVKVSPVINEMQVVKIEEEKEPEVKGPALWEEK